MESDSRSVFFDIRNTKVLVSYYNTLRIIIIQFILTFAEIY